MVEQTPEELEAMLDAGQWLTPGQVADLIGASRSTVHNHLTAGAIRYRIRGLAGTHRECNPEDVRRLLDDRRRIHGPTPAE